MICSGAVCAGGVAVVAAGAAGACASAAPGAVAIIGSAVHQTSLVRNAARPTPRVNPSAAPAYCTGRIKRQSALARLCQGAACILKGAADVRLFHGIATHG